MRSEFQICIRALSWNDIVVLVKSAAYWLTENGLEGNMEKGLANFSQVSMESYRDLKPTVNVSVERRKTESNLTVSSSSRTLKKFGRSLNSEIATYRVVKSSR